MRQTKEYTADTRIAVTSATLERMREFTNGLGGGTTNDDAINLLLDLVVRKGEPDLLAGYRLRKKFQAKPGTGENQPGGDT